ncbi:Pepco domain-containing protein [Bradyrhizobium diazoefficiens]
MSDTIKVFSDGADQLTFRNALPSAASVTGRLNDVSADVLQRNLATLMKQVETLFASGSEHLEAFALKEVKVSVGVTGSGEFSLLGLTKASAELKSTFEITFIPKQK